MATMCRLRGPVVFATINVRYDLFTNATWFDSVSEYSGSWHRYCCMAKYAEGGDTLHTLFISATNRDNIDALRNVMYEEVKKIHAVRYPYNKFLY